jgi:hypothetical protein
VEREQRRQIDAGRLVLAMRLRESQKMPRRLRRWRPRERWLAEQGQAERAIAARVRLQPAAWFGVRAEAQTRAAGHP